MEKNKKEHVKGSVFLFFAFTLAGTSVIAARLVSNHLGIFTISVISLFFAVMFLAPLCAGKLSAAIRSVGKRQWLMLLLQALFGIFLFRMFLLEGLLRTSAGEAGILTGATPAITVILAIIVLKERAGIKSFAGILSTMGGILLVQGIISKGSGFSAEHFWGNTLVLCAAASESLFNVLSRMNQIKVAQPEKEPLDPMVQTMIVSGMALVLCIIPSLFEEPVSSLMTLGIRQWLALVWYGAIVTALAFICWYAGIRRRSAYAAAAFSGMMPFTALFLSVIVLGECAGWEQWLGGVLIVFGMLLIGMKEAGADSQPKLEAVCTAARRSFDG